MRHPSCLAGLPLLAIASSVPAQTTAPPVPGAAARPAAADQDEEEVVITGQRPRGSVVGDIPPEQTLSQADVRAYGVNNISDLLDQLAPQTASGRGRGGEQPVVLLNGRRISGFGEIRDLPTEAIQRVEILPEEVALKYGYPADQKVVNIVLRQRFLALVGQARATTSTDGGGTSTDPEANYVRIRNDERFSVNLRYQGAEKLKESQRDIADFVGTTDLAPYRTLRGSSQQESGNLVYARPIFARSTLTLNGSLAYQTGDSLRGLSREDLAVPAGGSLDPLHQRTSSLTGHAGASINGDRGRWRWTATGNYDHAESRTRTQTGEDAGGDPRTDHARSTSDTGNVQGLLSGPLAKLWAGDLTTSVKVGYEYTGFDATSTRRLVEQSSDLHRGNLNGQVNFDLPITSRRTGVLPWLGNFSLNANLAARRLSDFGTLATLGGGFVWTPIAAINLIGSYTRDESAPTLNQLGDPVVVTPQVRVFDYVRGQSVDVTGISGGNPTLRADDRHVWKMGVTLKPFGDKNDLTLSANYVRTRTNDAITSLPEPTSDLEAAFPDRFIRDAAGTLVQVDSRPVNFERQRQDQLRYGFNVSINLKSILQRKFEAWIAARRAGKDAPPPVRFDSFQPVLAGNKADQAQRQQQFRQRQQAQQAPGGQPPDGAPPPPGESGGPPPGGSVGGPPPGGGFGGGGRGFGGGRRGAQQSGRLQIAIYDTWTFRDDVLIRRGVPLLDLLDGDSVGSGGGTPEHQVQAQLGYSNNGLGLRAEGNWKSATVVRGDGFGDAGALRFSSLSTLNLRAFADLGAMPKLASKGWARGLRVTFAVNNLFDERQLVRDVVGNTPLRYQPDYLDPLGRTVSISVRKLLF